MILPPHHRTAPVPNPRRETTGAAGESTATAPRREPSRIFSVVPAPVSVRSRPDADFQVTRSTTICAPGRASAVGDYLAGLLRPCTSYPLPVAEDRRLDSISLLLDDDEARAGNVAEAEAGDGTGERAGYRLSVDRRAVVVRAATPAGLFAGVQTLRQLLPSAVERGAPQLGPWVIPGGDVVDYPRFAHRGVMLDVSRHFFTIDEVRRFVESIARYKLNVLHLHLTDDQGWRIEIKRWPRLATHGGSTAVGGGPGGYYTQQQYRDLVAYAAARNVTVIPEIDIPGHSTAALASYAELNCDDAAPPLFTGIGTATGFSSLCTDKEITYRFVDEVLGEVAALTPGKYLHIGTDETHATPEPDYLRFLDRVLPMVARHGKTVIGWQELLRAKPPVSAVAQYWGRGTTDHVVAEAAARGNRIILSPASRAYLDMKYTVDTPIGLKWAGFIDVDDAYDWDPGSHLDGVPPSAVLGVEAPLWTETVERHEQVEYMAFPRVPAIAELAWSPWSTHDWATFRRRLAAQEPRWAAQGLTFHRSTQIPWSD